jgi:murein L,D-transpeptidase YafK
MKSLAYWILFLGVVAMNTSFRKHNAINPATADKNTYSVYIYKGEYELKVYDSTGEWMASYPVVFGSKDLSDKMMQGDRKTPEGVFHISGKRKHDKWNRFILIDYPNEESVEKFRQRKADGLIPANAKIGGEIGIHGTWPHEEYAIDQFRNWTEGCISTKNKYVQELFNLLPVGTRVEIRR